MGCSISDTLSSASTLEQTLIEGCLAGQRDAWQALHELYSPIAASFVRKLGVPEADIADVCQEVFLQLFRSLPTFRGESALKTWLYRLCATQANRFRRRMRGSSRATELVAAERDAASGEAGAPALSDSAMLEAMARVLAELKEKDRVVFVLYELEGLRGKQIAEVVGCPEATVWRSLHYARRSFREALLARAQAGAE